MARRFLTHLCPLILVVSVVPRGPSLHAQAPATPAPTAAPVVAPPAPPVDPAAPMPVIDPAAAAPLVDSGVLIPPGLPAKPVRKDIPDPLPTKAAVTARAKALEREISTKRIRLLDAVRITLLQDSQIQLGKEDTQLAEGALKIASGQFDTRAVGAISYDKTQRELQESQVAPQVQQRKRNLALIKATGEEQKQLRDNLAILRAGGIPQSDTKQDDLTNAFNDLVSDILKGIITPDQLAKLNDLERRGNELAIETTQDTIKTLDGVSRNAQQQLKKFPVNSVRDAETVSYELGLLRQFRNGISVQPFLNYERLTDNFSIRGDQAPIARSEIGLRIDIPLGKNFGTATVARERSAGYDLEASRLVLQQTAASSVLGTVLAYWNVVAAQERLALLVRSELISGTLVRLTGLMIDADELAKSEITQVRAREINIASARISAELDLITARQNLGLAMGLTPEEVVAAPLAADPFPGLISPERVRTVPSQWYSEALSRRADRQASIKLEQSGKVLVEAARINLRPRVDLSLRGTYSGLHEDADFDAYYGTFLRNQAGPGIFAGLSLEWPFANYLEKGRLQQSEAGYEQSVIQTAQLSRNIVSNVLLSAKIVQKSLEQLNKAQESEKEFLTALETEREKFKLGSATLVDTTVLEERLTNAGLDVIAARLLYAQGLARLRFETGTLVPANALTGETRILRQNLVTLPTFPPPGAPAGKKTVR